MSGFTRRIAAEVLGVREDSGERTIKAAYRRLAVRFHPDKNRDNPQATEAFQLIGAAYEFLCRDHGIGLQLYASEDFLYAAEEGDFEEVKGLIEADIDITITDKWVTCHEPPVVSLPESHNRCKSAELMMSTPPPPR